MALLSRKQIEGFETISNQMLVGYQISGNTVTLTRRDGTKFSFTTKGTAGSTGDKGVTGDKGATGVSAYNYYKDNNLTTAKSEIAWINSLKGATGDKGATGNKGATGDKGAAGTTPTFSKGTVTKLAAGSTPTASLTKSGNTYKINVGIPIGASGSSTVGDTPVLKMGTVTTVANNGTPTASISKSSNTYTLNLGIPRGTTGSAAPTPAAGANGTEPTVNVKVTMGSTNAVSPSVSGNTWTINLTVQQGAQGDQGASGAGYIYYAPISTSTAKIGQPTTSASKGLFFSMSFKISSYVFGGWSMSYGSSANYTSIQNCFLLGPSAYAGMNPTNYFVRSTGGDSTYFGANNTTSYWYTY